MDNRILLIIMLFCFLASQAKGQNSLEEIIKKNTELEKKIESLIEDSTNVKNKIIHYKNQISIRKAQNETIIDKKYNISTDTLNNINQKKDSLEMVYRQLQDSVRDFKSIIRQKEEVKSISESKMRGMKVFSDKYRQQKYDNNRDYLKRPFSQITLEQLDSLNVQKEEFRDLDNYFDYCKRISAAIANKVVFSRAMDCINQGIEYQRVKELRLEIVALLKIEKDNNEKGEFRLSSEQFIEFDSIDIKLSRMNNGIKELQKIITAINKNEEIRQSRSENNKERSIELIKQYINPHEKSDYFRIHQRYFMMIPYLNNLLNCYWVELKQNPFMLPTKSEEIIMKLNVE